MSYRFLFLLAFSIAYTNAKIGKKALANINHYTFFICETIRRNMVEGGFKGLKPSERYSKYKKIVKEEKHILKLLVKYWKKHIEHRQQELYDEAKEILKDIKEMKDMSDECSQLDKCMEILRYVKNLHVKLEAEGVILFKAFNKLPDFED
uniref:Uncharacterized protein n=1 Tax=Clastoptera arizonana TaxID=38151 RepID=A0A1B6CFA6_9HEMI